MQISKKLDHKTCLLRVSIDCKSTDEDDGEAQKQAGCDRVTKTRSDFSFCFFELCREVPTKSQLYCQTITGEQWLIRLGFRTNVGDVLHQICSSLCLIKFESLEARADATGQFS